MAVAASLGLALGRGVDPSVVVGGVALVAALLVATRRLEALIVLALVAFFLPSLTLTRGAAWAPVLRWVLDGTVLLVLAARVAVQRSRPHGRRIPVALIVFTVFAVATTAWSVAPRLTLGRAITFASLVAILALIRTLDDAPRQVANALRILGALIAVGSVLTLPFGSGGGGRYSGIFTNPNAFGVAAALLFPFLLDRSLVSDKRWPKIANGALAALLVAEAAAAASRGGLLAAAAAYLYLGWSRFRQGERRRRFVIFLFPALVAVIASAAVIDPHRFSSVDSRTQLWSAFPPVFSERPLLGHGFGTTQVALQPLSDLTGYARSQAVEFHNSYLNLLVDLGAIGGLLFVLLLVRAIARRKAAPPVLTAVVVAGLVSALFESWLLSVGAGFSFVFWFALVEVATGPRAQLTGVSPK